MRRRMPAAVIFDNDGLTLDTEQAWTHGEARLFERYGVPFSMDHKRELLGTSAGAAAVKLERMLDRPGQGAALQAALLELALEEVDKGAPPMPGARELLAALRSAGTPVALASNSPRVMLDRALAASGLAGAFDAILCADDVAAPKPAPDVYLAAAAALDADPADCVALEDSRTGVAAGLAAGMFVIGVPSFPGVTLPAASLVAGSLRDAAVWEAVGLGAGELAVR